MRNKSKIICNEGNIQQPNIHSSAETPLSQSVERKMWPLKGLVSLYLPRESCQTS